MNKIIKNLIVLVLLGIVLGTIAEFALILNINFLVKITQSLEFWGFVMILVSIISKEYKYSIIYSIILMITMNSTYYTIRLIKSGYTNVGNWEMYNFICIGGTLFISTLIFIIKEILVKKKNYFRIFNLITMIILGMLFVVFNVSLGLRFNNLMQYVSLGFIVAFILSFLLKIIYIRFNNKTVI